MRMCSVVSTRLLVGIISCGGSRCFPEPWLMVDQPTTPFPKGVAVRKGSMTRWWGGWRSEAPNRWSRWPGQVGGWVGGVGGGLERGRK